MAAVFSRSEHIGIRSAPSTAPVLDTAYRRPAGKTRRIRCATARTRRHACPRMGDGAAVALSKLDLPSALERLEVRLSAYCENAERSHLLRN